MLVTKILKKNSILYKNEVALVSVNSYDIKPFDDTSYADNRFSITWYEFNTKANQVANYYNGIGIGRGNKVGIMMMNCLEWLPIYFGIIKSGAIVVPLNYRYETTDIVYCINLADIDALIIDQRCVNQVKMGLTDLNRIRSFVYVGNECLCPEFASYYKCVFENSMISEPSNILTNKDDVAIYFSSGTTGYPKAVVYTNGTLEASCIREQNNHGQTKNDSFICIPPLYHVGAKFHWLGSLLVGGKGVILNGFTVPAFFEVISREDITVAFILLPWAQDILLNLDNGELKKDKYSLKNLRLIHMGAQDIPPSIIKRLKSYFSHVSFDISYGLTESGGPGVINLGSNNLDKLGSIGKPAEDCEAKIVDNEGNEIDYGAIGELLIKGTCMMRCYYKDEFATNEALKDGWIHTGDMAKKDSSGFYYIMCRKKDIIIRGGENIYPASIEDFLTKHKFIKDVAVFGVYDSRLGEEIVALVELNPGATCTEKELLEFCKPLPRCKRPKKFFFGDVPRNPTGKIEKAKIRKKYSSINCNEH